MDGAPYPVMGPAPVLGADGDAVRSDWLGGDTT